MSFVSAREKKIDAIVEKLFGTSSPDIRAIMKMDLMSKSEAPDEETPDEALLREEKQLEENKEVIQHMRDENQVFSQSVGHLQMTYDALGNIHTITQVAE